MEGILSSCESGAGPALHGRRRSTNVKTPLGYRGLIEIIEIVVIAAVRE
jgi:hypothetical protein